MSASFCRSCRRTFKSIRGFDAHRVGRGLQRRCMTDDELIENEFAVNKDGRWISGKSYRAWHHHAPHDGEVNEP